MQFTYREVIFGIVFWEITVANLPPTSGKQWEHYQAAYNLKWAWKHLSIYANSTTQRCPKKIMKTFQIFWRFFPFAAGVNDTGDAPWAANISANFRKKFEKALMGWSGAWGKLIHVVKLKSKISWHCPFKVQLGDDPTWRPLGRPQATCLMMPESSSVIMGLEWQ